MPSLKGPHAEGISRTNSPAAGANECQETPPSATQEFLLRSRPIAEFRLPRRKKGSGTVYYDRTNKVFWARISTPTGFLRRRARTRAMALKALDELIAGTPKARRSRTQRLHRAIPLGDRFYILERDGFACHYCGATAADAKLVVDHVLSVTDGGTNDLSNLVTACQDCNLGKSRRSLPPRVHPIQLLNRRKDGAA